MNSKLATILLLVAVVSIGAVTLFSRSSRNELVIVAATPTELVDSKIEIEDSQPSSYVSRNTKTQKENRVIESKAVAISFSNGKTIDLILSTQQRVGPALGPAEKFSEVYYPLVEYAIDGDAVAAAYLGQTLQTCRMAFRTESELTDALKKLRTEGVIIYPDGTEPLKSHPGLDHLSIERSMRRNFKHCGALSNDQFQDAEKWLRIAADGGDIHGVQFLEREIGHVEEIFDYWQTLWGMGHTIAAQQIAIYHMGGFGDDVDSNPDPFNAYVYQLIAFKIDEAAFAGGSSMMMMEMDNVLRSMEMSLTLQQREDAADVAYEAISGNKNCCLVPHIEP